MKKKSVFSQIIFLIILALVCFVITVGIAIFIGTFETTFFNFKNLNFSNTVPVLIIGGFISYLIIGISVIWISKEVFIKVRDYFIKINNKGEK